MDDPLAGIDDVVRWSGGFLAIGTPVLTGSTSRTPVWTSTDGTTWRPLAASEFGTGALVVGAGATRTSVVVLALTGGTDRCTDTVEVSCFAELGPLRVWTSADGRHWVARRGPQLTLPRACEGCGVNVPDIAIGAAGILVRAVGKSADQLAWSQDGSSWTTFTSSPFPRSLKVQGIGAFGASFVAVGSSGGLADGRNARPVAVTSTDARHWIMHFLPIAPGDLYAGAAAQSVLAGPAGLVVTGGTYSTPGLELWWSSRTGASWSAIAHYRPLGTWTGQGEGTGLMANGNADGDSSRLIAYRGGSAQAAWTSRDGRTWTRLRILGSPPPESGPGGDVRLTAIGLCYRDPTSGVWFAAPGS